MAKPSKASNEEEEEEEPEEEEEETPASKKKATAVSVNIAEPLFFWIMVLVLALFSRVIITYTTTFSPTSAAYSFLNGASNFFLFNSGTFILPLIVGAVIGAEIGLRSRSVMKALRAGLINGVYAAIVYIIAMVIIYEVIIYVLPKADINPTFLITNLIVPQVIVLIVLVEIFAALSHSRKVSN